MTKKLYFLYIIFIVTFCKLNGQVIGSDGRSKDVYNFYKAKSISLPITAATTSFKINVVLPISKGTQYYVGSDSIHYDTARPKGYRHADSTRFTLAKSFGVNFSAGAGNLLTNLAKAATFHPTYTASLGIGRNIDVFNDWKNIQSLKFPFNSWNISVYGSWDNLIIYDTVSKTLSGRRHPFTKGITGEGTIYIPYLKNFLPGVSVSLTYEHGNNISDLKNFIKDSTRYVAQNVYAVGDYVGKFGDYKESNNMRLRLSLPMFPKAIKLFCDSIQLCIIPYYSAYGIVHKRFNHLLGTYVNISQGQNLFSNNSTVVPGFGIGVDWKVSPAGFSKTNVFVAGSFDIYKLLDHKHNKARVTR